MKKYKASLISLAVAGLMAASASQAAVKPASVFMFDSSATVTDFNVRVKSWHDPAFGDMGWTHHSQWGAVSALKGQVVTIKLATSVAGLHPGITVWYRGAADTASDDYVVDHFYPQNAPMFKLGATDDTDGTDVGNIVMKYVTHRYDRDSDPLEGPIQKALPLMRGNLDTIPGQVTVKFTAPQAGKYMFVVGGVNPDPVIAASTAKHPVTVTVTVTGKGKL
ncbi:MAG: copper(I)-binding protein CorA [Methylococcaceae bacterium]